MKKIQKAAKLQVMADELETSLTKLSLAWCLKNPHVSTVILGASKEEQLKENLEALDLVPKLNADIMEKIESIVDNKPKPFFDWKA